MRIIRFQSRNPAVVALVVVVLLVMLAALLTVGLAVGAGLAVLGGGAMLARRVLGGRLTGRRPPPLTHGDHVALDPRLEVLPPSAPSPPDRIGDGRGALP